MKPFAHIIPEKGGHVCHDCGYRWMAGMNGNHSCVQELQRLLAMRGDVDDLKAKLDLAVEALLPLAKIASRWRKDELDESRPISWGDSEEKAAGVEIYAARGGGELLFLRDAFRAEAFFKKLGIDI